MLLLARTCDLLDGHATNRGKIQDVDRVLSQKLMHAGIAAHIDRNDLDRESAHRECRPGCDGENLLKHRRRRPPRLLVDHTEFDHLVDFFPECAIVFNHLGE